MKRIIAFIMVLCVVSVLTGCAEKVPDSQLDTSGSKPDADPISVNDDDSPYSDTRFAVELLKAAASESREKNKNVLISPISAKLALSMAANGADGETLAEMERVLGGSVGEINEKMSAYMSSIENSDSFRLNIANSIWYRDFGFKVNDDFLRSSRDCYDAEVNASKFDMSAAGDINRWVDEKTDGMIDKIIDKIDEGTVAFLINALAFDAKWKEEYKNSSVADETFTAENGEKRTVSMMRSWEDLYIECEDAVGFIKPYKDTRYSFAALLPDEDVNIYDFIDGLTEEKLKNAIDGQTEISVSARLPKFGYDFDIELADILSRMGISKAFNANEADFSKLGVADGNIYITRAFQKTHIDVDRSGTKAAAVTVGIAEVTSASWKVPNKTVVLDRPFVYMILDNTTNMPLFIGVVVDITNS